MFILDLNGFVVVTGLLLLGAGLLVWRHNASQRSASVDKRIQQHSEALRNIHHKIQVLESNSVTTDSLNLAFCQLKGDIERLLSRIVVRGEELERRKQDG